MSTRKLSSKQFLTSVSVCVNHCVLHSPPHGTVQQSAAHTACSKVACSAYCMRG